MNGLELPLELSVELATRLDVSIDDAVIRDALASIAGHRSRRGRRRLAGVR